MKETDFEEEKIDDRIESETAYLDEESLLEDEEINPMEAAFWRGEGSA